MAEKPYDRLDGVIWYDGKLVPWGDATLHVLSHGLHYASSVFEGERAYGGEIFRCTGHSERLKRSAQLLDFEIPFSIAEIDAAKRLVLEKNCQSEAYVPPIAWRGSEMMGVSAQNNKIYLAIATWQWPSYFDPEQRLKGIRPTLPTTGVRIRRLPGVGQGIWPLHDLHDLQAQSRAQRLCRCHDARLARTRRRMHRRQHPPSRTAGSSPPSPTRFCDRITRRNRHRAGEAARHRGASRAPHHARRGCAVSSQASSTGSAAEVTAVSEIAHWRFTPGTITQQLMADYTAEVQPKGKKAAA